MQKTISIPKWAIVLIIVVIIVGGVWIFFGPSLPIRGTSGTPEQVKAQENPELEADAREIVMAILDLDYNDQASWKDRLSALHPGGTAILGGQPDQWDVGSPGHNHHR